MHDVCVCVCVCARMSVRGGREEEKIGSTANLIFPPVYVCVCVLMCFSLFLRSETALMKRIVVVFYAHLKVVCRKLLKTAVLYVDINIRFKFYAL